MVWCFGGECKIKYVKNYLRIKNCARANNSYVGTVKYLINKYYSI